MADMDPVARARAIAARLAATAIPNDALGKRKSRWEVCTVVFFSICVAMWCCVWQCAFPCRESEDGSV